MNNMLIFNENCDRCGAIEERVFVDSYTGVELCLLCLSKIAMHVTNSPQSEEDNLRYLIRTIHDAGRCSETGHLCSSTGVCVECGVMVPEMAAESR